MNKIIIFSASAANVFVATKNTPRFPHQIGICRESAEFTPFFGGFRRNSALVPANAGLFHYAGNNPVRYIKLADTEIVTTSEHPFWVKENGRVIASEVRKDNLLRTKENEYFSVLSVEIKLLDSPVPVYNFEVENAHTYFVGGFEVLVHNSCRIKNIYNSIMDSPSYPKGFKSARNGLRKVKINNMNAYSDLRNVESGKWKMV